MKPQARNPATACPSPHQHAKKVRTHCFEPGKYSRKTVVSRMRFPPPPKPTSAMKTPRLAQVGMAPEIMADSEHMKSEMLKAKRRPMMSALNPQKRAPVNMPTYTAMVSPFS